LKREAKNPPLSDFLIAGTEGWGGVGESGGEDKGAAPGLAGQPWGGGVGLGWLPEAGRGQKDSTILKIPV